MIYLCSLFFNATLLHWFIRVLLLPYYIIVQWLWMMHQQLTHLCNCSCCQREANLSFFRILRGKRPQHGGNTLALLIFCSWQCAPLENERRLHYCILTGYRTKTHLNIMSPVPSNTAKDVLYQIIRCNVDCCMMHLFDWLSFQTCISRRVHGEDRVAVVGFNEV